MKRTTNVIALVKDGERYVFLYDDASADSLLRLSRMASDLPQLAEADFNPVLATPRGVSVLDARLRLLPRRPHDPYLRRLR